MGDPLRFEETGLFSAFSTRWRHTGVNLPRASEPEAQELLDLLTLLVQGLPCPHSALLSHCPGSPPHPFTQLYRVSLGIQAQDWFGGEQVLKWVQKNIGLRDFFEVSTPQFLVFEVAEEFLPPPLSTLKEMSRNQLSVLLQWRLYPSREQIGVT